MSSIHQKSHFRVAAYDVDQTKKMTMPGIITQLQEVALESTRKLAVSVFDLEPHHLGWVLLGQRVEVDYRPELAERCTVITAPTGFERVFTFRDFHLLNEVGEVIAHATTTWMLMNTQTRRMARLPDWIKKLDEHSPPITAQLPRADYKLIEPEGDDWTKNFTVGFHDLDFNGHLTNAIYVRWMLEALPYDILMNKHLKRIEVQYGKEARYGDQIMAAVKKTDRDGCFHHGLFSGQECLASMQSYFTTL